MKDVAQHVVDAKAVGAAVVSATGASVQYVETIEPYVAVASGVVAIIAGIMAIVWTGIRIYDRYKGK
jgi:hypothetical protein